MDKRFTAVLLIVIGALLVSAVLISQQDEVAKNIYATAGHEVTLINGSTITTPDPFLSPELQLKIWSLAPIGVFLGAGLAIFLLFFKGGKR